MPSTVFEHRTTRQRNGDQPETKTARGTYRNMWTFFRDADVLRHISREYPGKVPDRGRQAKRLKEFRRCRMDHGGETQLSLEGIFMSKP